jgi:Protein of unknown function (DUF2924)
MRTSRLKTGARAIARAPDRPKRTSESEIERQIEALEQLDLAGARWAWREATGRDAAPGASRDLLIRSLAYQLQARAYGDLDRRFKRLLDRIANGEYTAIMASSGPGTNLKPGTILVREYKGELHQATVLAEGYAWNGQVFPTLSGVARAITRANWNGYVFFGLKPRPGGKAVADG